MKTVQPTAEQKRWRESVRALGMGEIIHHATDRTMKIKGVGNIGHWWLVPCETAQDHQKIHTLGKMRKLYEKCAFEMVVSKYEDEHGAAPLPDGVLQAIKEFSR